MRRPAATILALLSLSCTPRPPEPQSPDRVWSHARELPSSVELAGAKVSESRDGPWLVRTAGGSSTEGSPGMRGARRLEDGASTDAVRHLDRLEAAPPATAAAPADPAAPAAEAPLEIAAGAEPASSEPLVSRPEGGAPGGGGSPVPGEAGGSGGTTPVPDASAIAPPLRAGSTDDNQDFDAFLAFLAQWSDRPEVAPVIDYLDVSGRVFLRVVNVQGKPVPGARVAVVDEAADRLLGSGTTYGDGRVPFYPGLAKARGAEGAERAASSAGLSSSLLVEVSWKSARKLVRWDGKGPELTVEIDAKDPVTEPIALDVLFLIDTTGSMGDEIDRIKSTLLEVTRKLRSIEREFDLRYGAVLYRDLGDPYVTKAHPFTGDIGAFDEALRSVVASGGGDGPESLNQGLAEAVGRTDWRDGAAKLVFLIADAPPHMDYAGDVRYGESLRAAVDRGIRIHAVAASGLDATGSFVFRQVAQFTRGKFIFIEYGSVAASAASHGVAGEVKTNNLDDIILEQIRTEVASWGRT